MDGGLICPPSLFRSRWLELSRNDWERLGTVDGQAAYLAHLLACPICTGVHRLPGLNRCPAGAIAWRDYLAALPPEIDYARRRAPKGNTHD